MGGRSTRGNFEGGKRAAAGLASRAQTRRQNVNARLKTKSGTVGSRAALASQRLKSFFDLRTRLTSADGTRGGGRGGAFYNIYVCVKKRKKNAYQ